MCAASRRNKFSWSDCIAVLTSFSHFRFWICYEAAKMCLRLIEADLFTSWCRSSIHHEFLGEWLICHPGPHGISEEVRGFQVPGMADGRHHHRLCRERPAKFTRGSICPRQQDFFLSKRYQDRCLDSLRHFHCD